MYDKLLLSCLCLTVVLSAVVGRDYNQPCDTDSDCTITNLFCVNSICNCKKAFKFVGIKSSPGLQKEADCIPVLNSKCDTSTDCSNLEGAVCEERNCICQAGFLPSADDPKCTPISAPGKACTMAIQCTTIMGQDAECKENICSCKPDFHVDPHSVCKRNKVLNDVCGSNDECYQEVEGINALTCDQNKCNCKDGYKVDGDKCNGSSRILYVPLTLITSFLLINILRL